MGVTEMKKRKVLGSPDCDRCGAGTRLFGIEAHPTIDHTELRTYVCGQCDAMQTAIVPLRP
jgi:ribosomal protein S27AE